MAVLMQNQNLGIIANIDYNMQDGGLFISYNIRARFVPQGHVYKLYALCSSKPGNQPLVIDTPEFCIDEAAGKKRFSKQCLLEQNLFADEIDTFVIADKNLSDNTQRVIATGFERDSWNVDLVFENAKITVESPLERAAEVLEKIKSRTARSDASLCKYWRDAVNMSCQNTPRSKNCPSDKYEWYSFANIIPPVELGAYEHILFCARTVRAFAKNKEYLFGVGEGGHTAVALREECINPFENADDCAVKIGDYYVVGVYLGNDGQYFERVLI